jgi:hypothetical protein
MEPIYKNEEGFRRKTFFKRFKKIIKEIVKAVAILVFYVYCLVFFVLGFLNVYDSIFLDNVPFVSNLGMSPEKKYINMPEYFDIISPDEWTSEERFEFFLPSMLILDKVCPDVSYWVREKYESGNIIYDGESNETLARYDFFTKKLIVTEGFFSLKGDKQAAVLSHEFRHSRQSTTKIIRRIILIIFTGNKNEDFIENDAFLFENEIYFAIHS